MISGTILVITLTYSAGFHSGWNDVYDHDGSEPPFILYPHHGEMTACEARSAGYEAGVNVATQLLVDERASDQPKRKQR